jgi:hypothetical protein
MKHQNIHEDKLIFDYLEGNLSRNERSVFEDQVESDHALREEIAMWKLTFLEEPFSATPWSELLMRPVRKSRWTLLLNSFTFGFLLFVASGNSKEEFVTQVTEKSIVRATAIVTRPDTIRWCNNASYAEACTQKNNAIEVESAEKRTDGPSQRMPTEQWLAIQKTLQITFPVVGERKFEFVTQHLPAAKKISLYRQASRKELRAINRKKRKQHALKLEKEFLKGNIPYVVPLDLKNF